MSVVTAHMVYFCDFACSEIFQKNAWQFHSGVNGLRKALSLRKTCNVFVLIEQFNHHQQKCQNVLLLWSIMHIKTDENPKREKSFAGIEGTRLRFDIYFVKRQVLSGFNTVLVVEFIERDW